MAYYDLCLFLFLSLLSATKQPQQAALPPHSYVFVVQWPNSYCNAPPCARRSCAHPIPQHFTIHGLWPNDAARKPMPPGPGAAVLNFAIVSQYSFLADLNTHWPNLNGRRHYDFGEHQWKTHWTGSTKTLNEFFLKAIDLIKHVDKSMRSTIIDGLRSQSLIPGPGKVYNPTKFPSAVFKLAKVVIKISCNFDTANNNQLHEIHLCLDGLEILKNCTHQVLQQKIVYHTKGCNPTGIAFP